MRKQFIRTAIVGLMLCLFLVLTHPDRMPIIGLIIPFLLLIIVFYNVWLCIGLLRIRYFGATATSIHKRLGLLFSIGAVFLIGFQSLGQLSSRDVLTVTIILILVYAYFMRGGFAMAQTRER